METAAVDKRYFFAVVLLVAVHAFTSFVVVPVALAQNKAIVSVLCIVYVTAFSLRFRRAYYSAIGVAVLSLVTVFWRIEHAELFQRVPFQQVREVVQGALSGPLLWVLLSRRVRRQFYATSSV